MLGFRLHPGFSRYALSPPFLRRMALNPPPCPEHVFWPRDRRYGNPYRSPDGWTRSHPTPPGGWLLNDDRQTLTAHAASGRCHTRGTLAELPHLASRRAVR